MPESADIIVIGGGIAGVSAGAALARDGAAVVLLEAEDQLAYHSTGRSAAVFFGNYGPPSIRALSAAGRGFFTDPPAGFSEHPLVGPRGVMLVTQAGQEAARDELLASGVSMKPITAAAALAIVPLLRRETLVSALYEADAQDIDVAALHGGFLKQLRAAGGRVVTRAEVRQLEHGGAGWFAHTAAGDFTAPVVVNAAGAWADVVAERAGLGPLGLVPKRRTGVIVDGPGEAHDSAKWPVVGDAGHGWYFKPEAGRKLMLSPADETPVPPCDVQPEELDIALAVDRFERAVDMQVRRVEHSWAGLRTFAPDGTLALGWDPRREGFFWLAGQGGYGIQTSPAAAALAAGLIRHGRAPDFVLEAGLDPAVLAPDRLLT